MTTRIGPDRDDELDDVEWGWPSGSAGAAWYGTLAEVAPGDPVELPDDDAVAAQLRRLDVPAVDVPEIVAARPDALATPELWWLLERQTWRLAALIGTFEPINMGPDLPGRWGPPGRWFHVWSFLAAVPAVRRFHDRLGIPDEIAWATLDQLGEMVAIHRREYGRGGMNKQAWFQYHLRGVLYELGRLQFGLAIRNGDPVLDTHIPEVGPLDPAACDESFARAVPFFAAHFPEFRPQRLTCTSWLLDPQLADHLPADSNIVRFMRRWTLTDGGLGDASRAIVEFVFRMPGTPVDELPQRTSLERAVVEHLRSGGHWYERSGAIDLSAPPPT